MQELVKLIEESALQSVMVDGNDPAQMVKLHTAFEAIEKCANEIKSGPTAELARVSAASAAVVSLIEEVILREVEDAGEAVKTVSDTAKALQELIAAVVSEGDASKVKFPGALGVEGVAGEAEAREGQKMRLPENVDEEIFGEFMSNQPYVLANLESAILTAEDDPSVENRRAIKAILHNMKGESGLMGLQEMSSVCHEAESLLENDAGVFPGGKLLAVKDWLQGAVVELSGQECESTEAQEDQSAEQGQSDVGAETAEKEDSPEAEPECLRIAEGDIPLVADFIAESGEHLESAEGDLLALEENPGDSEKINAVFRAFHTVKGVAGFLNLQQIGSLAHVTENLLDLVRKGELELSGGAMDVVFEAADVMKQMLDSLSTAVENSAPVQPHKGLNKLIQRLEMAASGERPAKRVGEILVEDGAATATEVREVLHDQRVSAGQKKVGELLQEQGSVSEAQVTKALARQEQDASGGNEVKKSGKRNLTESTVKVTTGRLDSMVDMVGELVIAQSMVSQDIVTHVAQNQRLQRNVRHLEKITRDLQELSMSMRMVPVQGVFQKMARLVRDLSRKAGKEIEFAMIGAETELDRNVVEAIADPLVHMVRNSVDHGIEMPEERVKANKKRAGRIELKAFHQAGNIVIEIIDDGRGLDREKIVKKAVQSGILAEGEEISDAEVYRLIFHAGLSTAEKVTAVSGRGVGMDVVKKNIDSLRGRVDIDSELGRGSRFSIRLPLTLAVIEGQVVTVGDEQFIIPTLSIEQNLRPKQQQVSTVQGGRGEIVNIRGDLLPLIRLHDLFKIAPVHSDVCEALVVVVADGNSNRCCLLVDNLLGQQQVVIKNLGEFLGNVRGISGGAIMGDGNVSLILDVPGLISLASAN